MNCLTTPYLTELVGPVKFSNAMGIVNLFRGIACFLGPLVGGFVSDTMKSQISAFYFSAICFSVGLFFSFLASFMSKLCKKQKDTSEVVAQAELDELNSKA
jgi:dipeptide/tripeptide permease